MVFYLILLNDEYYLSWMHYLL